MSGIVAVMRIDGALVERSLIERMTATLALSGPDGRSTWIGAGVALGHSLLETNDNYSSGRQPLTLDGQTWIAANVRLDARRELLDRLGVEDDTRSDAELVLLAYQRWGSECVEHLLGDYSFIIWDSVARRLFCARDQLGIRPLYYARVGAWLLVSNVIDCIRAHDDVSGVLNESAVADFLLFGCNQDLGSTTFRDIQRLSPAHVLSCENGRSVVRRVLGLSDRRPAPLPKPSALPRRVSGLDGPSRFRQEPFNWRRRPHEWGRRFYGLAAVAAAQGVPVHAYTYVFDRLIPDDERHYSSLAAAHLGIPIETFVLDDENTWYPTGSGGTPEPFPISHTAAQVAALCHASSFSRVLLFGEGPDNALHYEWRPYVSWLLRSGRPLRLTLDVVTHMATHRTLPFSGRIGAKPSRYSRRLEAQSDIPAWLNKGLAKRLDLDKRETPSIAHPTRPNAYAIFTGPLIQRLCEELEPVYTGAPVEFRHPYYDLRLLRYMLRVPPIPWCRNKQLIRTALAPLLPAEILQRPKTPLAAHPDYRETLMRGMPPLSICAELREYGDPAALPAAIPTDMVEFRAIMRFVALSYWIRNTRQSPNPYLRSVDDGNKELCH